jgi:phosphate acetyltransferase
MKSYYDKARSQQKHIVLPEGTEPRTIEAASIIASQQLARVTLIGPTAEIQKLAREKNHSLNGVDIIDPNTSPLLDKYTKAFYELRKSKGVTEEKARQTLLDPVYFGTMMVHVNDADGLVSGAEHSTADTIRPALQIIKCAPGVSTVSSAFIMIVPDCEYGANGLFIFADCAVIPNPNAEELAAIAIASAETARVLANVEPKVALLSFSTKGSAEHELVDKVRKALSICKEKAPHLDVDGELQVDAAIIAKVGQKKAPGSKIAGFANVLVFPDLQSGNCGYKLVERLAKAKAIGPFLQGLNKPVNDLSRGCSVQDIVDVVAVTSVQAQGVKK